MTNEVEERTNKEDLEEGEGGKRRGFVFEKAL